LPGIRAIRAYSSAEIAPSLGRPLAGNVQSRNLETLPAGTLYGDRIYQLDWRIGRSFRVSGVRIQPNLDVYNLFNGNGVLTDSNAFGRLWRIPTGILDGRLLSLSVNVNF